MLPRPHRRTTLAMALTALAACGGGGDSAPVSPDQGRPIRVTLSVGILPLTVGATGRIIASVTEASGSPIGGRAVEWSVASAAVATIVARGDTAIVTAVAPGGTDLVAAVGQTRATARVEVTAPRDRGFVSYNGMIDPAESVFGLHLMHPETGVDTILTGTRTGGGYLSYAWSPDFSRLVIRWSGSELRLVSRAGATVRFAPRLAGGASLTPLYRELVWSPDGRRILLQTPGGVFVATVADSSAIAISRAGLPTGAAWVSNDLVVFGMLDSGDSVGTWLGNVHTGARERLTSTALSSLSVSVDGRWAIGSNPDWALIDLKTREMRPLPPPPGVVQFTRPVAWSPTRARFVAPCIAPSQRRCIVAMNADGSDPAVLEVALENLWPQSVSWHPDGVGVLFLHSPNPSTPLVATDASVFMAQDQGTRFSVPRQLTTRGLAPQSPRWVAP